MTAINEKSTRIFLSTDAGRDEEWGYIARMEAQGYRVVGRVRLSQRNRWEKPTRWRLTMALTALAEGA